MSSKKKSDLASTLDELRSEDAKKRLAAVCELKEVAGALGATRVRGELIGFLAEFIDDEEHIVLELLSQLQSFTACVGGPEQEKCLIPLLISFCKMDEKKPAFKASALLQRVLANCKELAVETIKKLMKTEMTVAKECGAQLIVGLLGGLQGSEGALVELYFTLIYCDNPQYKIIGAKYLQELLRAVRGKEEVGKMLETIYNEGDELCKIYAMKGLIDYYEVSSNSCLTKFKNLTILNSWRININICNSIELIAARTTKPHFKLIFEPTLIKFLLSPEPELRAAASQTLPALARNMTEEELKSRLLPTLKKLTADSVDYVKVELSKNIVPLCGIVSSQMMNEALLPMIFAFIRDPNSEISLGVVRSFDYLAARMSRELLEEKIIRPLLVQLGTDNWRNKCHIIEILRGFLVAQTYLNEGVLKVLFGLTDDRIDAVRLKANQLIIDIVAKNSKDWSEQYVVPKINAMKENASYLKRQNLLEIIEKTTPFVSDRVIKEVYQNTVATCLADKVSNVRLKTVQVLKAAGKLNGALVEKQLEKLKDDKDSDVREMVKKLRA